MKAYLIITSALLFLSSAGCQTHIEMIDQPSSEENIPEKAAVTQQYRKIQGGILYVDANVEKEGNGRSWKTAYRSLQAALDAAARNGAELWVATGTYIPQGTSRDNCFTIADGIKIYGSLPPGATTKESQDTVTTPTILSGDIGNRGQTEDNCYHVVSAGTDVLVDSFVISDGTAVGEFPNNAGAGIHFAVRPETHKPYTITLNRVIFRDNQAEQGGALFVNGPADITIDTSYFTTNSARYGGSILSLAGKLHCNNVHFFANTATFDGGALSLGDGTQAKLTSCLFTNNNAGRSGGAIQLRNNLAASGKTSLFVDDSLFSGNRARDYGGAVHNSNSSHLYMVNSHLHDNFAQENNNIATLDDSLSKIEQCVFIGGKSDT